jgi:hypothetical protein
MSEQNKNLVRRLELHGSDQNAIAIAGQAVTAIEAGDFGPSALISMCASQIEWLARFFSPIRSHQ